MAEFELVKKSCSGVGVVSDNGNPDGNHLLDGNYHSLNMALPWHYHGISMAMMTIILHNLYIATHLNNNYFCSHIFFCQKSFANSHIC